MNRENEFWGLLERVQEAISEQYADVIANDAEITRLKTRVEKYLRDHGCELDGYTASELADALCREMAGYSILTPYLGREDVNEINVNAWNDVAVTFADGRTEKLIAHFRSPRHAVDVVRRLLHKLGHDSGQRHARRAGAPAGQHARHGHEGAGGGCRTGRRGFHPSPASQTDYGRRTDPQRLRNAGNDGLPLPVRAARDIPRRGGRHGHGQDHAAQLPAPERAGRKARIHH